MGSAIFSVKSLRWFKKGCLSVRQPLLFMIVDSGAPTFISDFPVELAVTSWFPGKGKYLALKTSSPLLIKISTDDASRNIIKDLHTVHMFLDASSVEIFINNGEEVFSARYFPFPGNHEVTASCMQILDEAMSRLFSFSVKALSFQRNNPLVFLEGKRSRSADTDWKARLRMNVFQQNLRLFCRPSRL